MEAFVWRQRRESSPAARKGRAAARGLDARRCLQNASCSGGRFTYDVRPSSKITLTVITVSTATMSGLFCCDAKPRFSVHDPRRLMNSKFQFALIGPGRSGWVAPGLEEHAPEAMAEFLLKEFMDIQQKELGRS
jgi:hypothetical protein